MILDDSRSVILDSNGNGTARIGPEVSERWDDLSVYVSVSTNNAEAQATLYMGSGLSAGTAIAQTATGSSGDTWTGKVNQPVHLGQQISVTWSGGDPGARATMSVTGSRTPVR